MDEDNITIRFLIGNKYHVDITVPIDQHIRDFKKQNFPGQRLVFLYQGHYMDKIRRWSHYFQLNDSHCVTVKVKFL